LAVVVAAWAAAAMLAKRQVRRGPSCADCSRGLPGVLIALSPFGTGDVVWPAVSTQTFIDRLFDAVEQGDAESIRALVAAGAGVKSSNVSGRRRQ
jgi:hypothetical protein